MSSAAKSIVAYGAYLIIGIALPFLFLPDVLLPLVGIAGDVGPVLWHLLCPGWSTQPDRVLPLDDLWPVRGSALLCGLRDPGPGAAGADRIWHPGRAVYNLDCTSPARAIRLVAVSTVNT
jgi:hypothetical protein